MISARKDLRMASNTFRMSGSSIRDSDFWCFSWQYGIMDPVRQNYSPKLEYSPIQKNCSVLLPSHWEMCILKIWQLKAVAIAEIYRLEHEVRFPFWPLLVSKNTRPLQKLSSIYRR